MKYFGTDGFRGEANVGLNADHAYKIGRFLGWYYGSKENKKCTCVVGRDTRRSGEMFEYAITAGLIASGADVYLMHVTTTPSISYITHKKNFNVGIMITASHNPFHDNGIKVINSNGYKMEENVLEEIEKYIDGLHEEIPFAQKDEIGCTVDFDEGRNIYEEYLISLANKQPKNIKIAFDCANGSTHDICKSVFEKLGADFNIINNKPDGFNINLNCGSTSITALQEYVVNNKMDIGFAFDGDGDRCIMVNGKGQELNGDIILYVCALYLKKIGKLNNNKIVTTVMANMGLYKALDKLDIGYIQTPVGDKYVAQSLTQGNYSLGGEQSGHIIFTDYDIKGDAILASIKLLEVVSEYGLDFITNILEEVFIYPQLLVNVKITGNSEIMEDEDIKRNIKEIEESLGEEGRYFNKEKWNRAST